MSPYKRPNKVSIFYFTGTGSTKLVADQFAIGFRDKNIKTDLYEINYKVPYIPNKSDLLIILYPVYALNAPEPVYQFIRKLPRDLRCSAVVISISGGGEVTPNNSCRVHCIKRLEKMGFPVVYEQMIVMPSNFVIPTPEELCIRLLEILPKKVNYIINELLSGVIRRTKPDPFNRFLSFVGEIEKAPFASKFIGSQIKANDNCNGCRLCQRGCPVGNIRMKDNKPVFGKSCVLCLKCIYSCPRKALYPGIGKFIVLKQGYHLKDWESKMHGKKNFSVDELAKGYTFSGIKRYLKEDMD